MGSGGGIVDWNGGQEGARWLLLRDGMRIEGSLGLWAKDLGFIGSHVEVGELFLLMADLLDRS